MTPVKREIEFLYVDLIEVHDRARPVSGEAVKTLASSMSSIGLRTPISVRYYPARPEHVPAGETDDALILMTGAHRLEAAKALGWEKIECFVYQDGDEIDAQLWEIAENLHRAELTALQRDEQVALWVELSASRISSQPETKMERGRPESGVNAAARDLGLSKADAHRAVKVASLSDEAKDAAREVGLDDNRTALLAASKAAPEQQASIIRDYAEQKQASRNKIDGDVKARAAREVAEMISEHVPGEWWDALKANLYAAGAANIAHELTNITGQSIMDRRFG